MMCTRCKNLKKEIVILKQALRESITVETPKLNLEAIEKDAINDSLKITGYFQKSAARLLGISARALNYRISKHKITHKRWGVNN